MLFHQILILMLASVDAKKGKATNQPNQQIQQAPPASGGTGSGSSGQAILSTCDRNVVGKGNTEPIAIKSSVEPFQLQDDPKGTSEYFSECSYTPDTGDTTPPQRNVTVKTDCPNPKGAANFDIKGVDFKDYFCSGTMFNQVPRSTLLAKPPKCDPTYPNSPGSREFFMRVVNTWRDIAHLKFNECLSKRSNRAVGNHDGFYEGNNICKPTGCSSFVREAAFVGGVTSNWWKRIINTMCPLLTDAHRGIFLNGSISQIGYYYTWRNPRKDYYVHIQSC